VTAQPNQDIKARLLATFKVEAEEHLQAIRTNLLALDRELPPAEASEVAETVFREIHTLKGAARSVSLMEVEALCQAFESVMSRVTRGRLALARPALDRLHEAAEGVARLLAGAEPRPAVVELISGLEGIPAEPASLRRAPAGEGERQVEPAGAVKLSLPAAGSLRLPAGRLDALLLRAEDLLVPKLAVAERLGDARSLVDALGRCRAALGRVSVAQGAAASAAGLLASLEADLRAVDAAGRAFLGRLTRDEQTLSRAVDAVLEEMRRIRMTPASTVLDLFPPMVRDLAAELGKEVTWVARGTELEVDRKVLELVKDPLIHLVRNAVDHGIETPAARAEAGKAPRGRVSVTVLSLEGHRVEIRVEDDGGGIDLARVKAAAVRARVLTSEEAEALPDDSTLALIYRSGVSTSPIITDVSGHGLGLAIVKERVERLGGQIVLETGRGGTVARMILPATIATFRGLLVRAGGQSFLLQTESVERVTRLSQGAIQHVEGRETISWNGHALSVAPLSRLLGLPEPGDPAADGRPRPCVIVRSGEEWAAFLVDEIQGDREGLVKELRPPLVRVRNVAGAGLLGTGQVVLILRPEDLLRSIRESPRPPAPLAGPEPRRRQPAILVVDDSITTRTMEKNLLEAAGYQVRVAVDGVEAWTALRSEALDLVVSDVDMPRMDGFELTRRIRADGKLADLPVVLVTALESREDKERGIEVGANAYVIKSSFDQSNLLEIIRRLV
jgi:two-component system chemotaxis sensor kinase CheA